MFNIPLTEINSAEVAHEDRFINYRGMGWLVLRHVFPPYPNFGSNRIVSAKNVEMYADKRVLDLGCGSGIRGIIAAMSGAETVIATDLDPVACHNTVLNARMHDVKVEVAISDMFQSIKGRFDTIVSYLPSIDAPRTAPEHTAIHDPGLLLHKTLIQQAPDYLIPKGRLFTTYLDQGGLDGFLSLIDDSGYIIDRHATKPHDDESWNFFELTHPG